MGKVEKLAISSRAMRRRLHRICGPKMGEVQYLRWLGWTDQELIDAGVVIDAR